MAKKNNQELSFTEEPIFGSLIRFALPVLGALVLQAAYGAVDLLVVGQFGDAAGISEKKGRTMQVPAESFDQAVLYILICSAGILIIIAYNVISGILRGVGNANLPFLFVGIACAVNVAGDFLLVGVLKMDVAAPPSPRSSHSWYPSWPLCLCCADRVCRFHFPSGSAGYIPVN